MDLKTLGQFNLLGDPSIHPAVVPNATGVPKGFDTHQSVRLARRARRARKQAGGELEEGSIGKDWRKGSRVRGSARPRLANIARAARWSAQRFHRVWREDAEAGAPAR
jgi:hypothetical protein